MNKEALKQYLIDNPDIVEEFLINTGFVNVKYYDHSNQWRFGFDETSSSSSIKLNKNLVYKDYKFSEEGDIISLVMIKKKINFRTALQYIASKTKFVNKEVEEIEVRLPYNGWYKHICKKHDECTLDYYDKNILEEYPKTVSRLFLDDGISITTQDKFGIRYCQDTHRIIIPCFEDGKLIGAIGRYNARRFDKNIPKYLPILRYNKSQYIFGADENKEFIHSNLLYVIESEKTVLEGDSKGINNIVAIGGNSISPVHKSKILKLQPSGIVVILDKGLGLDKANHMGLNGVDIDKFLGKIIISEAVKLVNKFIPVYYLDCNSIKEIQDKDNIFDSNMNKEDIIKLIDERKVLVNGK